MTQERLNHCFLMHVFKEAADGLEKHLDAVLEEFRAQKSAPYLLLWLIHMRCLF